MSNAKTTSPAQDQPLLFTHLESRQVVADFSGGTLSTDAGALLLREVDAHLGLTRALAGCFADARNQVWVEHSVEQMLAQRTAPPWRASARSTAWNCPTTRTLVAISCRTTRP